MSNTKESKNWLYEISFMRPILVLLLLTCHAFAPFCGAWEMPANIESNTTYKWIALFSRSFMLEAFIFVSGYIFAMQVIQKNQYVSITHLIKSKFTRLILPCWLFGCVYWVCFKTTTPINILTGIGHLWFLPCLFWCFMVTYMLFKSSLKTKWVLLGLVSICTISFLPFPLQLNKAMYYLLFFYLGGVFWKYSKKISDKVNSQSIILLLVLFSILLFGVNYLSAFNAELKLTPNIITKVVIYSVNNLMKAILAFVGISLLFMIASAYTRHHILSRKIVMIGTLGYGVYVFHQFVLIYLYYHTNLPQHLGTLLLPWVGLIIAAFCSIVLTLLFRSTKIGRLLI